MSKAREEQLRSNRRLARQLLGAVALLLVVIGLFTVIGWILSTLRVVFDDTDDRRAYENELYGLVIFDALPFEDASQVDPAVFRQAAIWSTLYQTEQRDGSLDVYERDSETGSLIIPRLEIETYLTNLLGPDFANEDGNFSTYEFNYTYDAERQGYYVPVTGAVGQYIPKVERIARRGGRIYVTVGYIPTMYNTSDLLLSVPDTPTKYMDYVFERGANRQPYLVALQESDRQPDTTPAPTTGPDDAVDPQDLVQGNLDAGLTATALPSDDGSNDAGADASQPEATDEEPAGDAGAE